MQNRKGAVAAGAAVLLSAALLAVVLLSNNGNDQPVELFISPQAMASGKLPARGRDVALSNPFDDAIAKGSVLSLSDAPPLNDKTATTLKGIKTKLARATQLFQEDKISEAELAGRLSREIDRHEKCRRHWPHLGKLESAQEIRVHDARNNLEVANRAMERARKELKDAEGLVMAARQVLFRFQLAVAAFCRWY